jgi:putative SOS response-associated peptidase YedK
MAGYYSWQLTAQGHRQPYFVRVGDRGVFGVAGLWDRWTSEDDDVIESCSVVAVPANELVSEIAGPLRGMPGILRRRDYATWLQGSPADAMNVLRPYEARWMHAYPVSPRVNSLAVDDPALIRIAY